jgi:hypothetical protein
MPKGMEKALILADLRTDTFFKVTEPLVDESKLTLDGVYQVAVAKKNSGKDVEVYDLSGMLTFARAPAA